MISRLQRWQPSARYLLIASLMGAIALPLWAARASAANTIRISLLGVSFDVSVNELTDVAKQGDFTGQWAFINTLAKPEQVKQIRAALTYTPPFQRETIQNLIASPNSPGYILEQLGLIVRHDQGKNGYADIKRAILTANQTPEGLNLLSFVKAYPQTVVEIDLNILENAATRLKRLVEDTKTSTLSIRQQAIAQTQTNTQSLVPFSQAGPLAWTEQTFPWVDRRRNNRPAHTTLFLPKPTAKEPLPLVVISYGLGEDRQTFRYLAQHLSSHGYAVAIPSHVQTDATKFKDIFEGFSDPPAPTAAVNRPKDTSFALNQLAQTPQLAGKINTQRVIVVGHSYGAYTALALGGAALDPAFTRQSCDFQKAGQVTLNISTILQCTFGKLPQASYPLSDSRVIGIVAADPIASKTFSPSSLQAIKVPTLFLAGSADIVVPMVEEATPIYHQLRAGDRYFVMLENGTHFSVLPKMAGGVFDLPTSVIGPSQEIGNRYFKALTLAFIETYLKGNPQAKAALNQAGAQPLSQSAMPLFIVPGMLQSSVEQSTGRKL